VMGSLGLLVRGGPKQSLTKHAFIFISGEGRGRSPYLSFYVGKCPHVPKILVMDQSNASF